MQRIKSLKHGSINKKKEQGNKNEKQGKGDAAQFFPIFIFYNGIHIRHCDRESDMERSMSCASEIVVGSRRGRAATIFKVLLQ